MLDSLHFTPLTSLFGGMMIGLATAIVTVGLGKITGISGIVGNVILLREKNDWRIAFITGLLLSGILYRQFFGLPEITLQANMLTTIMAGFLVGIGTRMGSGCTSGHGICGIARGSLRSITATCVFMIMGIITVTLTQWIRG